MSNRFSGFTKSASSCFPLQQSLYFFPLPQGHGSLGYTFLLVNIPPFLRKSILSPKCIFPVLQSLSPGVNLRLYHHSTETETHIYFVPKMAKSFDLLGFFRQQAHSLHMPPLTKLIHDRNLLDLIPKLAHALHVSGKRGWITTHVDHPLWLHICDCL